MSFFVNTMVCGFSLYQILAFFLIYSCLGWCLEVIYAAVSTGQLVNRGFLNGPVCPIYGFGMIIVLFTLSPLADNLAAGRSTSSTTPGGGITATSPSTSADISAWNSPFCGAWAPLW